MNIDLSEVNIWSGQWSGKTEASRRERKKPDLDHWYSAGLWSNQLSGWADMEAECFLDRGRSPKKVQRESMMWGEQEIMSEC